VELKPKIYAENNLGAASCIFADICASEIKQYSIFKFDNSIHAKM